MDGYELIAGILGGGVITKVGDLFLKKRGESRIDFNTLLTELRNDNAYLREENKEYRKSIDELREEITIIRSKMQTFESGQMDLPLPMWLKDLDGKMLSFNRAFVDIFLKRYEIEEHKYLGNYDHDVWPADVAATFKLHDDWVKKHKKVWKGKEVMVMEGETIFLETVKYPRYAGRTLIGVGGMCWIQKEEINNK